MNFACIGFTWDAKDKVITDQLGKKIVTFYDGVDYKGQTYTLFNDRLHYCVNFPRGPLIVLSAKLFGGTVCDLYTFVTLVILYVLFELTIECSEKDCTIESYKTTIYEDTPDTGTIEQFSMHCTTVPRS